MTKLLLVEDERNFGMVLRDYLRMNGFDVDLCDDGEQAWLQFQQNTYDMCVIDVMMPRKDGFTLVSEIRTLNKQIPLLFLTARAMREDVIKGYKLGADDYITKPFDSEVLLLKIQAILNRHQNESLGQAIEFEIGGFFFNSRLRTLKHESGSEYKLSPKEAGLLHLLCQHRNDVLPREKALKQIWKDENYFTGRSMDVYLVKLRKYLAADPRIEISNLHGNGYSLLVK